MGNKLKIPLKFSASEPFPIIEGQGKMNLDKFTRAYIECALWSSNDHSDEQGGEPLDQNYDLYDIAPETLSKLAADCKDFQETFADDLAASGLDDEQAGHDFWLTRNGHGSGFWDRGLGVIGEGLSKDAKTYGECNLYAEDGKVITD